MSKPNSKEPSPKNEPFEEEAAKPAAANEPYASDNQPTGPEISVFNEAIVDPRNDETLKGDDSNYSRLVEAAATRRKREKVLDLVGVVDAEEEQERIVAREQRRREMALAHPIPISFVTKNIQMKFRERRLNNEFFFYVPFLIAFVFFFVIGRNVEEAYWAGAQLAGQVGESELPTKEMFWGNLRNGEVETNHVRKTFAEVKTIDEWHLWLQSSVIDFIWTGGVDRNPKAKIIQNNYVEGGNIKIGALRIRQLRVTNSSCDWNENFMNESNYVVNPYTQKKERPCWGELSFVRDSDSIFKENITAGENVYEYVDCGFTSRALEGSIALYPCSGNVFDIPFTTSKEEALAMAQTLRKEYNNASIDFIDLHATRFIAVEMLVYHPALDQFTSVKALTEISQGGKFINTVRAEGFEIWSKRLTGHTAYFLCFFILGVFTYLFRFMYDFVVACKDGNCLEFCLNVWNFLEFANLVVFIIVFVLRCIWWEESEKLEFKLPGGEKYLQDVDYIGWVYLLQVYFNAFNTIAIFLKIMKYVELNPRLNLISRTMSNAQQNLVGVLIIFVLIVLAYSLTGVLLFSNGMEQFRDLEYSFSSLMRVLIGDFDYPAMRNENFVLAGLFFWSFNLLGLFLMLNFIIGVISASFNEEYAKTRVEPLHDTLARWVKEAKLFMISLIFSPIATTRGIIESRQEKLGESDRLTAILRTIEDFRMTLDSGLDHEQFMMLDKETRLQMLPDPAITRSDINTMFVEVRGNNEAEELLAWIDEVYVDTLWLDIHRAFKLAPDEDEANEIEEICDHIQEATEHSLKWVLGLEEDTASRRPDPQVKQIQELFAPGADNVRRIQQVQERLAATENSMSDILTTMVKLDAALDKMN